MFPVQIIQPQTAHLPSPEAVDGEQHQYWSGTDVIRLVTFGHGEQPSHIVPRWPHWQRCLREDTRSPNGRRQSFTAPALCFRKTKESPKRVGAALNCRPRMTSWFEQLLKRHVDPMRSDLVQNPPLDTQSLEEPPDPPTTVVNGHGRQFRFMLHVVSERFDRLRAGGERGGSLLQTPHKLEPSDGKEIIEAVLAGHFAFNLGESQDLSRPAGQSKHLCNYQQTTRPLTQAIRGVALVCEMCQEGQPLFQQGA